MNFPFETCKTRDVARTSLPPKFIRLGFTRKYRSRSPRATLGRGVNFHRPNASNSAQPSGDKRSTKTFQSLGKGVKRLDKRLRRLAKSSGRREERPVR